jgi:hypothetical protein
MSVQHRMARLLMVSACGVLLMPGAIQVQGAGPLALGDTATKDGLAIAVTSYATAAKCRGDGDGPAQGAKLLYVWIEAKNTSKEVLEHPSLIVELEGIDRHAGWFGGTVCRYDSESFGNSCSKDRGRVYPDASCEGWELFEVPARYDASGKRVTVSLLKHGKGIEKVAAWLLPGTTP